MELECGPYQPFLMCKVLYLLRVRLKQLLFWIQQNSVWLWFHLECASFLMDENVVLFVKLVVKVVYGKGMVFVSSI